MVKQEVNLLTKQAPAIPVVLKEFLSASNQFSTFLGELVVPLGTPEALTITKDR